eukprot:538583-Amphidinium_carterae.1
MRLFLRFWGACAELPFEGATQFRENPKLLCHMPLVIRQQFLACGHRLDVSVVSHASLECAIGGKT